MVDIKFLNSEILLKTGFFFFPLEPTDDDDDDEIQFKPTPIDPLVSTHSTNMSNSIELQRLTTSVETMRTSILQAYVSRSLLYRFIKSDLILKDILIYMNDLQKQLNYKHQH